MAVQIQQALIRCRQVEIEPGLSHTTIYQWMRGKTFLQAVRVGARSIAWRRTDIDAWLANPAGYRVEG
ncbi:AlpA family phage regulatory protein [Paraburkholderia sp. Ac-20342]|uniref:helix-turn-helix transcriptional regulator n=1 Tax=Paraburkholderia sp. Ac-20342 TaxID=2703889 RepID=UPI00197E076A|nr:AlpA family phage regulatory protein [Paraburkholderia sp. Ac-20342]MBN3851466.1 AlpA family phage regulatory protein [Paraburkholderia sp. Ac-20342]